jgi:2-polyprenyl-6-hydroxyphenyl methylase/3-demethylubiquinone-9 3-methyltransferase
VPSPTTISQEYYNEVVGREGARDAEYAAERILLKLSKLRVPKVGESIVDIGCGTGVITAELARTGLEATGVDVVPEFIAVAEAKHPSVSFTVGAAEQLPFPDQSFDFANLSSLLEHVDDWRKTLREAARVLAPGGVLYLSTNNRFWPIQAEIRYLHGFGYLPAWLRRRIYTWVMKHRPEMVGYTHLPAIHWLTYWQIANELRRSGLEPHSWTQLMDESDIPAPARRYATVIMALQRSPVPIFPFLPHANLIVARKIPP